MQALSGRVSVAVLVFAILGECTVWAQQAAPAQAPATLAWSPSRDIGVFVFPRNGQNSDQQLKDESECYGAARQATGIDPKAPAPTAPTAEQQQAAAQKAAAEAPQAKGTAVKGAAVGAAGGAAIGAIAGSPGKGAGAGAVAGTMMGASAQRAANQQSKQQAAAKAVAAQKEATAQAKAAHAEGLDMFQRAFGACMDARGYSVK
jgi:hypothetical protein